MLRGQSIFVGNIKGGVGKSTIAALLFDYFNTKFKKKRAVHLIDADRQGTSYEFLEPHLSEEQLRHVPVSDRFDGVSLVTLDSILRRVQSDGDSLTIIDTGAGWPGNVWQLSIMSECIIIPTSLSWADLRPTIEFVKEMDERKIGNDSVKPHLIIVPNRIPPAQRDLSVISKNLEGLNVILAPPLSDISVVRHMSAKFEGLKSAKDTRFHEEFTQLATFIEDYVLSGKLSAIYESDNKTA